MINHKMNRKQVRRGAAGNQSMKATPSRIRNAHWTLGGLLWLFAAHASATLGQAPLPNGSAAVQLKSPANASVSAAKAVSELPYQVVETTGAGGVVAREYVDQTGTVFAVTWSGPTRPDMKQLLGSYFGRFVGERGHPRGPLRVDQSDVVIQSGGHMGALHGRAWVRDLVPKGVDADALP